MKHKLLLLCGGRSDEHEISLISTIHILRALDRKRFEPIVVGIGKDGRWFLEDEASFFVGEAKADKIQLNTDCPSVSFAPFNKKGRGQLQTESDFIEFDVIFPVLHGPFGEDGTLQGMFEIAGVPYVGSNCGSSWICMDKALAKTLCNYHKIPNAPFVTIRSREELNQREAEIKELGLPLFVKPARQGSSVGISKVTKLGDTLEDAVLEAFCFDNKCIIEGAIVGREVECAVLGLSNKAKASKLGEIIPSEKEGFYSYDAKYIDESGAKLVIPAELSKDQTKEVQEFALNVFNTLECDGMARVDVFIESETNRIVLNEVNTIPGFTPISMYPKLWEISGLSYSNLITSLIDLAFERRSRTP